MPRWKHTSGLDAGHRGAGADAARAAAGLGLAVSLAIVEAQGGRVWLTDTSRGTRVRLSAPAEVWTDVAG